MSSPSKQVDLAHHAVELSFCIQERVGSYAHLLGRLAVAQAAGPWDQRNFEASYSWISSAARGLNIEVGLGMHLRRPSVTQSSPGSDPVRMAVVLTDDDVMDEVGDFLRHAELRDMDTETWIESLRKNRDPVREQLKKEEQKCNCPQLQRCPLTPAKRWFDGQLQEDDHRSARVLQRIYHQALEDYLAAGGSGEEGAAEGDGSSRERGVVDNCASGEVSLIVRGTEGKGGEKGPPPGQLYRAILALSMDYPAWDGEERLRFDLAACFTEQCVNTRYSYDKVFGRLINHSGCTYAYPFDVLCVSMTDGHSEWKEYAQELVRFLSEYDSLLEEAAPDGAFERDQERRYYNAYQIGYGGPQALFVAICREELRSRPPKGGLGRAHLLGFLEDVGGMTRQRGSVIGGLRMLLKDPEIKVDEIASTEPAPAP